jgi:plastocyanin
MRRSQSLLSIAFAATLVSGCLGSVGTPEPQTQTPTGGSGATAGGSGTAGGGGATSSAGGGGTVAAAGGGGSSSAGGGGTVETPPPDAGPPAVTGAIAIALDKTTDTIRLNESHSYTATITPSNGFSGSVTLSLDNPPAGVTATFDPAALMVSSAPATVAVTITVASDMATPAASVPLSIKGTSGEITSAASLGVMIPAELFVQIGKGVNIGTAAAPNKTAFGLYGMPVIEVAAGTKVTWQNGDTINHEIHSDGTLGIAHEGGPLLANGGNSYTQTFSKAGTFTYRCHIHPNMQGQIIVK